ncbi:unnamed protein product [Pieris brassicae]|uniref:Uncharacterized protein n=1 Tax=Pieris brassicae TaxID=7116 RepID=A0A9P0TUK5_PIEBR|nr:unnamed protein product [Pieris brassicae]
MAASVERNLKALLYIILYNWLLFIVDRNLRTIYFQPKLNEEDEEDANDDEMVGFTNGMAKISPTWYQKECTRRHQCRRTVSRRPSYRRFVQHKH